MAVTGKTMLNFESLLSFLVFVLLLGGLWFLFRPVNVSRLLSDPHPVSSYDDALRRIDAVHQDENGKDLKGVCCSSLMTHDHQTEHVIVFMHGYTNCPEQFQELGKRFFDLGYNVFIPCMPYHGSADRLTKEFVKLTAEDLAVYGDQAVDIACGLGRHVTVFGISGGGTVATWLAQNRADVNFSVPLAAFLRIGMIPSFLVLPFINLFQAFPNVTLWWDPRTKEKNPYSYDFAYPQYSLGNLAQMMRLARLVKKQAAQKPPSAGQILVVINDFDKGVSNAEIIDLMKRWSQNSKERVRSYHFESGMKMLHDIITPGSPGIPIDEVYQRLIEQVQALHAANPAQPLSEKAL